jgi:cell division transport system permease protein
MKIRTFNYFFKQAGISLWRNRLMSFASMATVAVCIFLVGIFSLFVLNVNQIASDLESNVEIIAFMKTDANRSEVLSIEKQIQGIKGVKEVKLVTKEQGLIKLNEKLGNEHDLLDALGGKNPLPDYYEVKAETKEDVKSVAQTLERVTFVKKVDYGQGVVERLFAVVYWIRLIGGGIVLLLSLGALFLISTTIRLTLYSRRKEIGIMKYIGATDSFIRWPFFIEGSALGFGGALIAVLMLFFFYNFISVNVQYNISFIHILTDQVILTRVFLGLLVAGTLLGALGSIISIRRFLHV